MITDSLKQEGSSVSGRDIRNIFDRLSDLAKSQNITADELNTLQASFNALLNNGSFPNQIDVPSAFIHNLITDGIATSKAITIRQIKSAGLWGLGHYGNDLPYQYRPELDVSGSLETTEDWKNIPAGTPVNVDGTIAGSNQVSSTAGGPSMVMISCGLPGLDFQALVWWTDHGCSAIYSQNSSKPFTGFGVSIDPNTNSPVLYLRTAPWVWDSTQGGNPATEIILTAWGINFMPINNSYTVPVAPSGSSLNLAADSGFAVSSLDLPENAAFQDIDVTGTATINKAVIQDATIENLSIQKTSVEPKSFDFGTSFSSSPDYVGDVSEWYNFSFDMVPSSGSPLPATGQAQILFYKEDQVQLNTDGTHYIPIPGQAPVQSIIVDIAAGEVVQIRGGSSIFSEMDGTGFNYLIALNTHVDVLLFGNAISVAVTSIAAPADTIPWSDGVAVIGTLNAGNVDNLSVSESSQLNGDTVVGTGQLTDSFEVNVPMPEIIGDLLITGDLEVTGTTKLDGDVTAEGNAAITGNETVGGTFGVTGKTTLAGGLAVTSGAAIDELNVTGDTTLQKLTAEGEAVFEDDVTFNDHLTAAAGATADLSAGTSLVATAPKATSSQIAASTAFVKATTGEVGNLAAPLPNGAADTLVSGLNFLLTHGQFVGQTSDANITVAALPQTNVTFYGQTPADYSRIGTILARDTNGKITYFGNVTGYDPTGETYTIQWTQLNSSAYVYSPSSAFPAAVLVVVPTQPAPAIYLTLQNVPAGTALSNTAYYNRIAVDLSKIATQTTTTDPITYIVGRVDIEYGGFGYVAGNTINISGGNGNIFQCSIDKVGSGGDIISLIVSNPAQTYATDPVASSVVLGSGSGGQGTGAIVNVVSRYAPGSRSEDGLLELVDPQDPLMQHSAVTAMITAERNNQITMSAVGIAAISAPQPANYNLRDGMRYLQLAGTDTPLPTSFPLQVQTWDADTQSWSGTTVPYTPTNFDAWFNATVSTPGTEVSYWNFSQWVGLSFTIDQTNIVHIGGTETISGQKNFTLHPQVATKSGSLRDPLAVTAKPGQYATEKQVQDSVQGLQLAMPAGTLAQVLAAPEETGGTPRSVNVNKTSDWDSGGLSSDVVGLSNPVTQMMTAKRVSILNATTTDDGVNPPVSKDFISVISAACASRDNSFFAFDVSVDAGTTNLPFSVSGTATIRVMGQATASGVRWMLAASTSANAGSSDLCYFNNGWGNLYELPDGGIPKDDLVQAVQDSLDLAGSALQQKNTPNILYGTDQNGNQTTYDKGAVSDGPMPNWSAPPVVKASSTSGTVNWVADADGFVDVSINWSAAASGTVTGNDFLSWYVQVGNSVRRTSLPNQIQHVSNSVQLTESFPVRKGDAIQAIGSQGTNWTVGISQIVFFPLS